MEMPWFNICYSNVQCGQCFNAATFSALLLHSGPNIQVQSFHATLESSSMVPTVEPNHKSRMLTRRCAVASFQLWGNQKQKQSGCWMPPCHYDVTTLHEMFGFRYKSASNPMSIQSASFHDLIQCILFSLSLHTIYDKIAHLNTFAPCFRRNSSDSRSRTDSCIMS